MASWQEKMKLKRGQSGSSRRRPCRSSGLTLTEMTVVIAVVALLTVLSLPAVRSFFASLANSGNARPMISAALSSARAIAAKEQRYAGIRFQTAYDPSKSALDAPQYMIFIVYDYDNTGLANGFRAVEQRHGRLRPQRRLFPRTGRRATLLLSFLFERL